jgi:hypothetical protein
MIPIPGRNRSLHAALPKETATTKNTIIGVKMLAKECLLIKGSKTKGITRGSKSRPTATR